MSKDDISSSHNIISNKLKFDTEFIIIIIIVVVVVVVVVA
jgi:hypothetical protein